MNLVTNVSTLNADFLLFQTAFYAVDILTPNLMSMFHGQEIHPTLMEVMTMMCFDAVEEFFTTALLVVDGLSAYSPLVETPAPVVTVTTCTCCIELHLVELKHMKNKPDLHFFWLSSAAHHCALSL